MAQFGDFTVDRTTAKYVLGSGGTIISYATDEPAFEFNADGSYKGLLVEPAATNLCLQSEDFGTTWLDSNVTVVASTEETPDGDTSSKNIKLVADSVAGGKFVYQNISGSGVGTFSVFAKKAEYDNLRIIEIGGYRYYANFDLTNGTTSGGGGADFESASIEEYPNGWYRCSVTTDGAFGAPSVVGYPDAITPTNTPANYTGDDTSGIYVWGAQFETGPIATSYIPTTTASVQRVKDDITLGSASSLIGQTEGTLYVEVDWRAASGTTQYLLDVTDGTGSNRMIIFNASVSGGQLRMFAGANGTPQTDQGELSSGYSGIQKIAFAYKTDDFELYRNGSSISTDTSGSLAALATLTDIDLGQSSSAGVQANMHIRAVALYTRRLTDAEAQALTTL
jgi:hypothetical protein